MSGRYGSAGSTLAPIVVGLRTPDPDAALLRRCWQAAVLAIPATVLPRAAAAPRPVGPIRGESTEAVLRSELLEGQRSHAMVVTADRIWVQLAKLVEVEPYEPAWASLRWRWLVGARAVEPRRFGEPFARCLAVYRIETLSYRLREGAVEQAPQLALFRHALVSGLRASRPDLVVAGGQHDWRDEWWASSG